MGKEGETGGKGGGKSGETSYYSAWLILPVGSNDAGNVDGVFA